MCGSTPTTGTVPAVASTDEIDLSDVQLVREGAEWDSELHRIAATQFDKAADHLGLDDDMRERLREPRRALTVNFPVRMDDGAVRNFTGYRGPAHADDGSDEGRPALRAGVSLGECARWPSG